MTAIASSIMALMGGGIRARLAGAKPGSAVVQPDRGQTIRCDVIHHPS
jgi:hypothetical protein